MFSRVPREVSDIAPRAVEGVGLFASESSPSVQVQGPHERGFAGVTGEPRNLSRAISRRPRGERPGNGYMPALTVHARHEEGPGRGITTASTSTQGMKTPAYVLESAGHVPVMTATVCAIKSVGSLVFRGDCVVAPRTLHPKLPLGGSVFVSWPPSA